MKMKTEIESMEEEESAEQGKLLDVKHEMEKYISKMKENQQKINHFKNEVPKMYNNRSLEKKCRGDTVFHSMFPFPFSNGSDEEIGSWNGGIGFYTRWRRTASVRQESRRGLF